MQHNPYLSMLIWEESLENKLFKSLDAQKNLQS